MPSVFHNNVTKPSYEIARPVRQSPSAKLAREMGYHSITLRNHNLRQDTALSAAVSEVQPRRRECGSGARAEAELIASLFGE